MYKEWSLSNSPDILVQLDVYASKLETKYNALKASKAWTGTALPDSTFPAVTPLSLLQHLVVHLKLRTLPGNAGLTPRPVASVGSPIPPSIMTTRRFATAPMFPRPALLSYWLANQQGPLVPLIAQDHASRKAARAGFFAVFIKRSLRMPTTVTQTSWPTLLALLSLLMKRGIMMSHLSLLILPMPPIPLLMRS
jgi:hypothetical protein